MALAPLLSHATARPRPAGTSFESQTPQEGRQAVREPGQPGPLNATSQAHCHPGQARTVYPKSQSGGYLRLSVVSAATAGGHRPGVVGSPPASAAVSGLAWWERLVEAEHVAGVVGGLDLPEPAVVLAVIRLPPVRQFRVGEVGVYAARSEPVRE